MEKLELKEIVGYLPYGLKVLHTYYHDFIDKKERVDDVEMVSNELITFKNGCDWYFDIEENDCDIKPILFPLSSLTEFRVDLGFVPMEKLFEIFYPSNKGGNHNPYLYDTQTNYVRCYHNATTYHILVYINPELMCENRLWIIEKLYQWKIDIHNLIERGLAIEVTKEFNPYKL